MVERDRLPRAFSYTDSELKKLEFQFVSLKETHPDRRGGTSYHKACCHLITWNGSPAG